LLIFLPAVLGLAVLALSMPRHHRDLLAKPPSRIMERALRMIGWAFMAVSFAIAIAIEGMTIGAVLWIGLLTVAAQLVALMLTYRDRWRRI
jgi:hypothetical protein